MLLGFSLALDLFQREDLFLTRVFVSKRNLCSICHNMRTSRVYLYFEPTIVVFSEKLILISFHNSLKSILSDIY